MILYNIIMKTCDICGIDTKGISSANTFQNLYCWDCYYYRVLKQEREKQKEQNILEEKKRELERLNNYGITDHEKQQIIDILETVEKSKVSKCILQFLNRESFKTTLTV